ncbi:hypothetical protein SAMN04487857_106141 [Pseudomonas sp. ok272]|uniref:hypothetical protein n=1 Tax=unclassified Pseudomonas TaxID=196821 RepID=UPI0008B3DD93|nr:MULTISPECIES: hypothetical protein [unclassified Pseudomonas]SEM88148.1 hypothetical protein SAMN04487857_106141 [Pseudomonas sp. ok272]SFM75334.1 hypothetical protein SAMN04487858_10681 [Pseudomonas sp. ok602]
MHKDDLLLMAGSLLSVSADVSQPWKSDALNSLLFSGGYANAMQNKFVDTERWGGHYTKSMINLKWSRSRYRSVDVVPGRKETVVLIELLKKSVSDVFGASLAKPFGQVLARIEQTSATQDAWAMFRESAVSNDGAETEGEAENKTSAQCSTIVLQINLLVAELVTYSILIYFKTSEAVADDFLNQAFAGQDIVGKVSVEVAQYSLDKRGYERSKIREKVLEALADMTDERIIDLCSECVADKREDLHD